MCILLLRSFVYVEQQEQQEQLAALAVKVLYVNKAP